jgi:hypothetical protein
MRWPREATIELLGAVFSVGSMPRLYNEKQLRLRESLGTAERRLGGWCEIVISLGVVRQSR